MNTEKIVNTLLEKLNNWLELIIEMLPNMGLAILLFILFFIIAKLVKKVAVKLFDKASNNTALKNLFSTIVYYTVLGIGLFIVLGILKLDKAVTSLLAGVGVLGLALGFAFQDIAANFVSGVILAFRRPFQISDIVQINDYMGSISRTNLRVTVIKLFQGQEVYIPNKDVLQSAITNYTVLGKRRIDLEVGVSYGEDLEAVEELVKNTISAMDNVIDSDNLIFDYHEFGGSSINFTIRFWITYPDQPSYLSMKSRAIKAIKKAFDANDITIPFPIRTLDFGIKGGMILKDALPNLGTNESQE